MPWCRLSALAVLVLVAVVDSGCSKPRSAKVLKAEGDACAADEECESSLCDTLPGKSKVCQRQCPAGCKTGDVCTPLATADRYACALMKPGLCQPCTTDADCPYKADRCLTLGGAKVCGRDCSYDDACPTSYRCADGIGVGGVTATKQCQPTSGTCECTAVSAGQTMACSETNAFGTCTGVRTCKPPSGFDACSATVPSKETCNGRDDDCNGSVDEGLGETSCGLGECKHTVANCLNGAPQTCEPFAKGLEVCDEKDNDCDGIIDNGFDKNSLQQCGACNTPCERAHATPVCNNGTCSIGACNTGWVNADGLDSNGCEYFCTPTGIEVCDGLDNNCNGLTDEGFSLSSDPNNCGMCGKVCNVVNGHIMTYACGSSQCGIAACSTGYDDCDQQYGTGCEKNVSADVNNCGHCNNHCTVAHGTPGCASSACTIKSCDTGYDNCNADVSDGCEQSLTDSVTNCSACGHVCPVPANTVPTCTGSSCGWVCKAGWVDLDGQAFNGCEYQCTAIGADLPDYPLFIDANCDGVDGDASQAIFVSPLGNDGNAGTSKSKPKLTLAAAIGVAATYVPRRSVFAAAGVYGESVTMASGVSVYGGYDPTTWQRASTNVSTIQSPSSIGVSAKGLSLGVELQLLTVNAANASGQEANGDGRSSIGVQISDNLLGASVTITACTITAGNGTAGANGGTGGTGTKGEPGGPAGIGGVTVAGAAGSSPCGATGGIGGTGVFGTTDGNPGKPGVQVTLGGAAGPVGSGGSAGSCSNKSSSDGHDATPVSAGGSPGNPGANGNAPAQLGALTAGLYLPSFGLLGLTGKPGGGGGGGGSGGGSSHGDSITCTNCAGIDSAGGGGGGGGACGGDPGSGGRGGGGSFAILISSSSVAVVSSTLRSSTGGTGGKGGDGGAGGPGGIGGLGAGRNFDDNHCSKRWTGAGAQGGQGGDGGNGGGATGGAGGPSICVAYSGTTPALSLQGCTHGTGGTGGVGGTNGLQNAPTAPAGLSVDTQSL